MHNTQVPKKKKMTEEDFIHNNRKINGENDLPRDLISEQYPILYPEGTKSKYSIHTQFNNIYTQYTNLIFTPNSAKFIKKSQIHTQLQYCNRRLSKCHQNAAD